MAHEEVLSRVVEAAITQSPVAKDDGVVTV
jgi:hypothetical protein